LKVRDVIARLHAEGRHLIRHKGSHRQFRHPILGRLVTVAGREGDDLHPKTQASIFKQAGWKDN
jgi:predicted RNA binding protein YcfA (HicA-like mRNA interferase family)